LKLAQGEIFPAQANIAKHGITFAQAASVLLDPLAVTVFDAAHSQEEERWFTLGTSSDGKLSGRRSYPPGAQRYGAGHAHHLRAQRNAPRTSAV